MIGSALVEALGLLLFVPMLAALGGRTVESSRLGGLFAAAGIPRTLGALLTLFVAIAVLRALLNFLRDEAKLRFQHRVVDDLRGRAWSALLHCDWNTLSQIRRSAGASLLITEIEQVGRGVDQLLGAIGTLLTLAGLVLAAFLIAPVLAAGALIAGTIALIAYRHIQRRGAQHGQKLGEAVRAVHEEFGEGLSALRVIKSFGCEDRTIAAGNAAVAGMRQVQSDFMRDLGLGAVALQGGGALVLAALVWLAAARWGAGAELILPLVALALRALPLLPVLHHCWRNWDYARPALASANALIVRAEAAREPDAADVVAPAIVREVALRDVTVRFAAGERPALDRVALSLPVHSITALLGPSGAGKSTLADVLGGLLVPDTGALSIDGVDLAGDMRRAWRQRVAYVQQDAWLFSGTIRDNLLWADPLAGEARLKEVLDLAAAGFVVALPDGLDTRIGDGNRALSGGERQRVVLARALLRDPELLILDEATSALDSASEDAIARAVLRLRERTTILVIGHRGRLTEIADRTVHIEAGHIEAGTISAGTDRSVTNSPEVHGPADTNTSAGTRSRM